MTTQQIIESIVNKNFDPISQKIDDIENYLKLNPTKQSDIFPYIITDELKEKMINMTFESYNKGIEVGFQLCKNKKDNKLIDKGMCKGTNCDIELMQIKCETDEVNVGMFHTHARHMSIASVSDLYSIYELGLGLIIVGGYNKDSDRISINSHERKDEYNTSVMKHIHKILEKDIELRKKLDKIDENPWNYYSYNRIVDKSVKMTNKLIEEYFNVINIVTIQLI